MATTQEILDAAAKLGKLIATHDAAKKYEQVLKRFSEDVDAQRLLSDMNRFTDGLAEKEAKGQPIEVSEKKQMAAFQEKVMQNAVIRDFQMVQMDYLDLMRRVDQAMAGPAESKVAAPAAGLSG